RRHGFNPWVGKIPWRRVWQPTRVVSPGESLWTEEPGRLHSIGLREALCVYEPQKKNKGDPMNKLESFYQEMIMKKRLEEFQLMRGEPFASHSLVSATSVGDSGTAENPSLLQDKGKQAAQGKGPSLHVAKVIDNSPEQCWTGPKKLTQPIEFVPEDEIQRNRLSEEEIRKIPMFSSYNPGEPNKNLCTEPTFFTNSCLFFPLDQCGTLTTGLPGNSLSIINSFHIWLIFKNKALQRHLETFI
ncbi:hypothetical protein FD755_025178, partial [Muntiacus reevesi]